MLDPAVLTPLPCGELVDKAAGQCCLTNFRRTEVRGVPDPITGQVREPDRKTQCLFIDACELWKGISVLKTSV